MTIGITITHDGRTQTVAQWSDELGIAQFTIRERLRRRLPVESVLSPVTWAGRSHPTGPGEPRKLETIPVPPEASEALLRARAHGSPGLRSTWDLPLEDDVWAQCLIEVAVEDGGFTLEEIAALMGGLCRERIRQIEEVAMRKIRRVGKSTGLDTEWQHEWDRRAG